MKITETIPPLEQLEYISPKSRSKTNKESIALSPDDVIGETTYTWNPLPYEFDCANTEMFMVPIQDAPNENISIGQRFSTDSCVRGTAELFQLYDTTWGSEAWEPLQTPNSHGDWSLPPVSIGSNTMQNADEFTLIAAALGDIPFEREMVDTQNIPIQFPDIQDATTLKQ